MKPWESVNVAMQQRHFQEVTPEGSAYKTYDGELKVGADSVPVRLVFHDDKFLRMPALLLRARPEWLPKSSAHLSSGEMPSLCYPGRETASIDRYDAGANVLGVLDASATLLGNLKTTKGAPGEIAAEFSSYWGSTVLLDMTGDESSPQLVMGGLTDDREGSLLITIPAHKPFFKDITDPNRWQAASVYFAKLSKIPPIPTSGGWPPKTFGALREWLNENSEEGFKALRDAIGWMHDKKRNSGFFFFKTPSVWFGFSVTLDPTYIDVEKVPKKHSFIGLVLGHRMDKAPITRFTASRVDEAYVITRNLPDGMESLSGLRILLVGVGAIGGYLADSLVRVGAGAGGGALVLVDPDRFKAGNVGRHRLTYDAINRYKVEAMADELRRIQPWVNVVPINKSVLDIGPLKGFDLVVDATGVRPLSLTLNEMYLAKELKKLVSAWIYVNGISVHALICSDRTKGCRQCLYTPGGDPGAYFPDTPDKEKIRHGQGCDAAYAPYTAVPALSAATVGLQAVLDIANDRGQVNYRVSVLDRAYRDIKDKALSKNPRCPACSQ